MPPWTPSPPVSVLSSQCLHLSELEQMPLCHDAEFQNVMAFASVTPTDSWADDEKYECDVGWQAFQASCYKLTSEKMDWDTAQKTCQKMEGNLVSIHTLPELEFIMQNVKKGDWSVFKKHL